MRPVAPRVDRPQSFLAVAQATHRLWIRLRRRATLKVSDALPRTPRIGSRACRYRHRKSIARVGLARDGLRDVGSKQKNERLAHIAGIFVAIACDIKSPNSLARWPRVVGVRSWARKGIVTRLRLAVVRLLDIQWNDETQLQGLSVPARDHPSGDLALFPVHIELSRRRRFVGGTRNRSLV
jgi:hypothetical protein